jgi:hypothetical protein
MKKLFVIIIILKSINLFANDTLRYNSAYEFLSNNIDSIKKVFVNTVNDTTNLCFIVSNQIIPFTYSVFIDEVMEYEYSNSDSNTRMRVSDSLKYKVKGIDYREIKCMCWSDIYKINKNCELIVFFGTIENNKMIAEIVIRHREYNDYNSIANYGPVVMTFLFYFDNDNISKVFSKVLLL